MPLFRKKPVEIEAVQFTEELASRVLFDGEPMPFGLHISGSFHPSSRVIYSARVSIRTFEGTMRADLGDWIIKGVAGELYPCKPDIFEKTYEPVVERSGS